MKHVRQFGIILGVTFLAELIKRVTPLPVPAGVYGLVLMLVALKAGLIKLEWVKETAAFLTGALQIMFIPAAAGLIVSYAGFRHILPQSAALIIVSTAAVIAITGLVVQRVQRTGGRAGSGGNPRDADI